VPYYNDTSLVNSGLYTDGTNICVGGTLPAGKLEVSNNGPLTFASRAF